jgi:hypothetical protein
MEKQRHSGLGVASFVTSIVSGILILLLMAMPGAMWVSNPDEMGDGSSGAMIIGFLFFGFSGGSLIALGLGIGGLKQKDVKKTYAMLGTIISAMSLLIAMFILFIVFAMD